MSGAITVVVVLAELFAAFVSPAPPVFLAAWSSAGLSIVAVVTTLDSSGPSGLRSCPA
jgi:hypothetical protein